MNDIAQRIFEAMRKADLSYGELSKLTGIPKSALQRYATGETVKIPLDRIEAIAKATNVTASHLLGWNREPEPLIDEWVLDHYPDFKAGTNYLSDLTPVSQEYHPIPARPDFLPITPRRIPMLGTIACGEPILAEEDHTVMTVVGGNIDCDFALRCKGDSMKNARIMDGDIVFIKAQNTVKDGEIAVVLIDDEATLKRVRRLPGGMLMLSPENPEYEPIFIGGENETREVRILGKAVAFQSAIV